MTPQQAIDLTTIQDAAREAGLDWHKGWGIDDMTNRFEVFANIIAACVHSAESRAPAPTEPAVDRDAVAWRHYLPDNRYFGDNPSNTFQTLDTLDEADEELGIHGGTVVPLFATPASPAVPAPAPLAPMQKLDYTNYSAPVTMSNSADLPQASQPTSAPGSILVRITATTEGYEDVHPDLMLEDAMRVSPYGWPQGFTVEVVQPTSAEGKDGEQGVAK